ncbi:hypothetical protein [Xanthomonas oryzae]|uniref:hypothetical protein n=1 Tax=Xanthomonas oryzae TaxID=347 RepID=UPI0003729BD8|nr:hypothetical protein [Xanthomonas oryzae]
MKKLLSFVDWLSGEWMLHGRSNSGAIVFLRSLLVSVFVFGAALMFRCAVDPDTSNGFSLYALRSLLRDHVGWLGAIFAATYVGFYTRYASQWSYISSLYNQIMATDSSLPETERDNETILNWQAAFIEDCYYLHLDRKEIFALVIKEMLDNPSIVKCLIESAPRTVSQKVLERNGLVPPAP